MSIYAIVYGSDVYTAERREVLQEHPVTSEILKLTNFLGTPLTLIEEMDPALIPTLKRDGYRFHPVTTVQGTSGVVEDGDNGCPPASDSRWSRKLPALVLALVLSAGCTAPLSAPPELDPRTTCVTDEECEAAWGLTLEEAMIPG